MENVFFINQKFFLIQKKRFPPPFGGNEGGYTGGGHFLMKNIEKSRATFVFLFLKNKIFI
ncbi:MAG: hypothetical protein RL757_435 [Bacteroidota bacterium]|jgi:hypothetical protein